MKEQYIGPVKVKSVGEAKRKTYLGDDVVMVETEDGKINEYPEEMFKHMVTGKKSDLSQLREDRVIPVLQKVLALLANSELTKTEIQYALGPKLELSLNDTMAQANKILWGKEIDELTLHDINQVFKKEKK